MFPLSASVFGLSGGRDDSFLLQPLSGSRQRKGVVENSGGRFPNHFVLPCYPKCGLGNSFLFAECLIYPMF